MPQPKSVARLGQAVRAGLSMAKSADRENAGTTQHKAKQREQSGDELEAASTIGLRHQRAAERS
ncbi:MAG TPA: hypothetical protein VIM10_02060 [Actinopolymorphaceae bacterium]|jgi:hypothetical protein